MTIPRDILKGWFGNIPTQENSEPDGNGNELYYGVAPATAQATDGSWIIAKGTYINSTQNGASVWWMTHSSFLIGTDINGTPVSWANAVGNNLVFP
jgi:hypothetical protein